VLLDEIALFHLKIQVKTLWAKCKLYMVCIIYLHDKYYIQCRVCIWSNTVKHGFLNKVCAFHPKVQVKNASRESRNYA
jgi:hypothetical protein